MRSKRHFRILAAQSGIVRDLGTFRNLPIHFVRGAGRRARARMQSKSRHCTLNALIHSRDHFRRTDDEPMHDLVVVHAGPWRGAARARRNQRTHKMPGPIRARARFRASDAQLVRDRAVVHAGPWRAARARGNQRTHKMPGPIRARARFRASDAQLVRDRAEARFLAAPSQVLYVACARANSHS